MKGITAEALAKSTRCLPFDDILFLPAPLTKEEKKKLGFYLRPKRTLIKKVTRRDDLESTCWLSDQILIEFVVHEYAIHKVLHRNSEPEWMLGLNALAKRHIRREWGARSEWDDPLGIFQGLYASRIGFTLLEGGIFEEAMRSFEINVLSDRRQLGLLTDPVVTKDRMQGMCSIFNHTRLPHVMVVGVVAALVGLRLDLSKSQLDLLRVAGVTHDTLTPAGGDSIKLIDPKGFDEDLHYPELLKRKGVKDFLERRKINTDALVRVVQGQGLLGSILDLADKISYLSSDLKAYLGKDLDWWKIYPPEGYAEVHGAIEKNPFVLDIWDATEVRDGQLVFLDSERLSDFLRIRALMFRELYYHPGARFIEHVAGKVIVKYLYDYGKLTRKQLLQMSDHELERGLGRILGSGDYGISFGDIDPRVEEFKTFAEARKREAELRASGVNITHIETINHVTRPGTHFMVRQNGRIVSFAEAYPGLARKIKEVITPQFPARLYYLRGDDFQGMSLFLEALESYRKQMDEEAA